MTAQILRGAVELATVGGGIPPLIIRKCEREDQGTITDDDEGPRRHGYTTSYYPTLIIALRQEKYQMTASDIVHELLQQAGIGKDEIKVVGWLGDTHTVLWVTLCSVEAGDTLTSFIVSNREQEQAGVEIFQLTYVYDD